MRKPISTTALAVLVSLILAFSPLSAANGAGAGFATRITYQNVGSNTAHLSVLYYPEGLAEARTLPQPDLAAGGSQTVSLEAIDPATGGTRGAVIVRSDTEVAAVTTYIPTAVNKARAYSVSTTGGAARLWLPFLNKNSGGGELLSIQNLDAVAADIRITFYGGPSVVTAVKQGLPAGGSTYVDLAQISGLPEATTTALVEATQSGTTTPGKVSAVALYTAGSMTEAHATEGIAEGATKVYMPLASCYGLSGFRTNYYVFNTSPTQAATVTVSYDNGKAETASLPALTARQFTACAPSGVIFGYAGSATITSNGPAILAVGHLKLYGMSATFNGQPSGASKLAVPIAHYSAAGFATGQRSRTIIYVMNLGSSLAAGAVKASYYGRDGKLVATLAFPAFASGQRIETSAKQIGTAGDEFGYYSDGNNGGSVIIEGPSGSNLIASAWVVDNPAPSLFSGDMYNALRVTGQ